MKVGNNNKKILLTTLMAALTLLFFSGVSFAQDDPFIPKYNSIKRSERCFTLTEDDYNQYGIVWFRDRGNFDQDTTLYFVVYMGARDGDGADGMAFVMHDDPEDLDAAGYAGAGLSFAYHSNGVNKGTDDRISPSVAIELDTWDNNDVQDGREGGSYSKSPYKAWDHTAVVYNGDMQGGGQQLIENEAGEKHRILPVKPWGDNNVEDNGCYAYKINWIVNADGTQTLELWADVYNPDEPDADNYDYHLVMRHTDDMIDNVFGGETNLRFGFTGSTGGARNEQTICLLGGNTRPVAEDDYASTSVNTAVQVDVEANDQDFDGDNLFVPVITRAPANGTATVVTASNGSNMIEYTPNTTFVGVDTIQYRTCDVDSDKCYALCDVASVIVSVGCDEMFIGAQETISYTVCDPSLAPNGAGEAFYVDGSAYGNFWVELFNYENGTTTGESPTDWWVTEDGATHGGNQLIYVESGAFRAKTRGALATWETADIDISEIADVNISTFIGEAGDMNNSDSIKVVYVLDGGPEVVLDDGFFINDFGSATATASGINGSTLKLKIYVRNTASGNQNRDHYWDNIHISGKGPLAPPAILDFHWYKGDEFEGTGASMGNLADTTYHVFAVDPTTGCRSDTVTVTISNTSAPIPDTAIFIVQEAPFTKCELPYDGVLRGGMIEDEDSVTSGYLFEWRYVSDPGATPIRTGALASSLGADDFLLTVISETTGCSGTKSDSVQSNITPPVIFPEILSHVYSCDDPNTGVARVSAEVDGVEVTSGITFHWYEGLIADLDIPADFLGETVNVLKPNQDYTIIAVDDATGCTSGTRTIHINDLRQNPVPVVTSALPQVSCDPSAPTGAFTAAVDDGGTNITSGFTFTWHKGLSDSELARTGYTGGPDVDQLPVNDYRLIVVNDTSQCFAVLDTSIVEDINPPVIQSVAKTDVDICGPGPNGTITVTPVASGPYKYRLYSGSGAVPGNLLSEEKTNSFTALAVGNYSVTVLDSVTLCESDYEAVNIADITEDPEAEFEIFPQISCDVSNPTGRITAIVSQKTASDHTFEWFVSSTSGTPVTTTAGTNGEIAEQLMNDSYAVTITDNTTQCFTTYYPTVGEDKNPPVIDTAYSVASVNCDPVYNGELLATTDGGLTDAGIFTFTWRDSGGNIVSTDAHVTDVAPGDYELIVTNDTTSCVSNPKTVTVNDASVDPIATIEATDNTSCDVSNPNGQLEVTNVANESPYDAANYHFAWYITNSSGVQLETPDVSFPNSPDSSVVFGLSENTYALLITNRNTNCSNEVLAQITDLNIKPILDYPAVTDATRCTDPYMSAVEVTSVNSGDPIPSDYSFRLENAATGDVFTSTSGLFEDFADNDGIVLPPGTEYRIIALNDYNCPSDTIEFEIGDDSVDPVFSLDAFDNTSCDVTRPNGMVEATTDGSYTISQIEWFITDTSGDNIVPTISTAAIVENDTLATGLPGDTYAVRITADNGCEAVDFASLDNLPANQPLIDSLYAENLTSCVIDNGLISLGVSPIAQLPPDLVDNRTYTFYIDNAGALFSESTNQATNPDSVTFENLAEGDWEAYVVDEFTLCQSDPITLTLLEAPEIEFEVDIKQKPSGCVANTGHLEISVKTTGSNEPGTGAGFDFDWFEGAYTSTPLGTIVPIDDWTSSADQLVAGYYTLKATDRTSQCVEDTAVFLNRILPPIIDNALATDATQCLPGDGELQVEVTNFPSGYDYSDYDYLMFEGLVFDENWTPASTTAYQVIDGTGLPPGIPVDFASTIEEGTYVVIAREKFGDNCFTDPKVVNVDLDYSFPDMAFDITSDNTCAGATDGTGAVSELNLIHANYDFQWYSGSSVVSGTPLGETSETITDKFSGTYTLWMEVTAAGPGLGCDTVKTVQIPKVKDKLVLEADIVSNFNCAPLYNGSIEITDVLTNTVSTGLAGFDNFTIKDSDNLDITGATTGDGTTTPWSDLTPATYNITARHIRTNCISSSLKAVVDDKKQKPVLNIKMDSPDYSCTDSNNTGELTATASPVPTGSYTWQWTNSLGAVVGSTDSPTISAAVGLKDDIYTVVVTDNDGDGVNDGCSTTRNITLIQGSSPVLTPEVTFTDQTICGDNGSISVLRINENREGVFYNSETPNYVDYSASLFDKDLNPITTETWAAFHSNGTFGNTSVDTLIIPKGTYYVKARNIATGCPFGPPTQAVIKDVSRKPVVNLTLDQPDYSCSDFATPTGIISAAVLGGTDSDSDLSNFTLTWRDKDNNDVTDLANPSFIDSLAVGTYTLQVTDNAGVDANCVNSVSHGVHHSLQEIVIVDATGTDQTWCRPNGTFQVNGLNVIEGGSTRFVDPSDPEFANYAFDMYAGSLSNPPFGPSHDLGIPGDPIDSLSADTYFAMAVNNGTLCESQPRQVRIRDLTQDPLINLAMTSANYSLNYDNLNSLTGTLVADAFEADGTKRSQGYEYKWYRNEVSNDSLFFSTSMTTAASEMMYLRDAYYFVEVTSDSTGCVDTAAINLPFIYLKPKFNPVVTAQTYCDPNGEIYIPTIYKVQDSTETFNKYQFDWHVGDYDQNSPEYTLMGGNSLTDLEANSYYIQALDTFWMVQSDPVKVTVADSTTYPEINYNGSLSAKQTSCNAGTPNGALSVIMGGFDNYSYVWFTGDEASGTPISTTETIVGKPAGSYTVRVTSGTTSCFSDKTFTIVDDMKTPVLAVSSSPVTNCVPENANGIASANVSNIVNSIYDFYWYAGESAAGTPDFTDLAGSSINKITSSYTNIPAGFYTVVARDTFDCQSAPTLVEVQESLKYPIIRYDEISPLTHCDPAKANAVFSATADDKVVGYTFEWNIKDGPLYAEGAVVNNLGNEIYRLVATNNITGCNSFVDLRPTESYVRVPSPIPGVLNDRTSCIEPNGAAMSDIYGKLQDYYFTYLGPEDLDSLTNPRNGTEVYGLDINHYFVMATDRTSGCVSDSIMFAIEDARYVPDYEVVTEPSSCMEPTGSAEAILSDVIRPYEVRWYDETEYQLGAYREILYQPAGTYYVAVEGTEGCIDSTHVEIGTSLVIFNGVSANNDGLNDIFHIECMDAFPDNTVKIYNRAGQLVYEIGGYDTKEPSRTFAGLSNRGPGHGNNLAVGTYFYVIDKGDGSEPEMGYLELTR